MNVPGKHGYTMTPSRRRSTLQSGDRPVRRRRFLLAGTAVSTALVAGCAGQSDSDTDGTDGGSTPETDTTTDGTESDADAGVFRLLISDRPAAIDDFDSLEVSFDRARVFRNEQSEGETETDDRPDTNETETEAAETESEANETDTERAAETTTEASDGTEENDDEADDGRGFFVLELDGVTVDLTQVVGEKAMGVFEDDLPTGQYSKIELHAADIEGIVDGEPASVKIPSGKLQIVKPFEVAAGETVEFVFDINVVKKGQSRDYNLLPVISESGVAGRDVSVEEVDREQQNGEKEGTGSGTETDTEGDQNDSSGPETDTGRSDGPQPDTETETDGA